MLFSGLLQKPLHKKTEQQKERTNLILGKKLIVIMPAYNAALTLRKTYEELPHEYVDEIILVDDASKDETFRLAAELGIKTIIHPKNTLNKTQYMFFAMNENEVQDEVQRLNTSYGRDFWVYDPDDEVNAYLITLKHHFEVESNRININLSE